MRTTPEKITKLESNQIFVFGSNQSGRHGKGAAKTALGWGAVYGQAEGLQGKTYGIPSKDKSIRRTLRIYEIKPYVDRFVEFAKKHPELTFLVTLHSTKSGATFLECKDLKNVWLPSRFWHKLNGL